MNQPAIAENTQETSSCVAPGRTFTRRNFLKGAAFSSLGLALYSGEIERHALEIVPRSITIPGLSDSFAGFKIVQFSDIHLDEYTEPVFLKKIVRQVNALHPDLVVITGDFVSQGPLPTRISVRMGYHCAEILSELTCPLRYTVLGNHDVAVSAPAVTDALTSHGLPVLENRFVPIERGNQRIWLAGIADALGQRPDLTAALPRPDKNEPVILLAHEPDFADHVVKKHPVSLILAGHTHGGQVRLPLYGALYLPSLGRKYVEGYFPLANNVQLYVNRGIGTVNLPFRLFCPPEITVITLSA